MKTPDEGSSVGGGSKKRHKRRAHATSEGSSGSNERSGNDICELCSSPMPSSRGSSGDKRNVHSTPLLHGHGAMVTSDTSLVTAFYCKAARLHGLLHQRMQSTLSVGGADFTEDGIFSLGNEMADIVGEALSITRRSGSSSSGGDLSGSSNPFVMLLSILLPPLRKFLAWTWTTRGVWYGASAPSSIYHQQHAIATAAAADNTARSNASNGGSRAVVSNPVLWTMLAQHDVITTLTTLFAAISRLIEHNEGDTESASLSSSLSASLSSPAPLSTSSSAGSPSALRIPQVHHIVLEFEDVFSEYRVCLAELTECLVENMETIATRLCRPVLTKDASKARGSANEFIELLVLQILDPVAKRIIESPSPSRLYLFPRLLDKCISVVINEFIVRGVRMNEITAAQVEKGVMYLRTWSLRVETDYNTRARALASANHDHSKATNAGKSRRPSLLLHGGSGGVKAQFRGVGDAPRRSESPTSSESGAKLYRANTSQDDIRGRLDARLELTTLDGFKRLHNHITQWLHNEKGDAAGPLPAVRSRGGNLAEGLRESFVRTFTARNSGGSVRFEG